MMMVVENSDSFRKKEDFPSKSEAGCGVSEKDFEELNIAEETLEKEKFEKENWKEIVSSGVHNDGYSKVTTRKIPVLSKSRVKKLSDGTYVLKTLKTSVANPGEISQETASECSRVFEGYTAARALKSKLKDSWGFSGKEATPSESSQDDQLKAVELDSILNARDLKLDIGELSYSDGNEDVSIDEKLIGQSRCVKDLKKIMNDFEERAEDESESKRQEKIIDNLYNILKRTVATYFTMRDPEEIMRESFSDFQKDRSPPMTAQQYYDAAIEDIYMVWVDAIGLVKSVRNHTLMYREERCKTIDREQLALEAEMLQLAIDSAINYSKLKSDFLLKAVQKHLQLKNLEKNDLETFMDSKLLTNMYGAEDILALAKTVRDLNLSIVKGEDSEAE